MSKTLILKYRLPTLNEYIDLERANWKAAAKSKKKHTIAVMILASSSDLELDHSKKYNVDILWVVCNLRSDPDNISHGIKYILDGLVKAGILKGDGHKQIGTITHRFTLDKTQKFTYSEITFSN